ncbi:MAG: hypothetical protein ACTSP3_01660 [Candidatus Heimdallarchaeaceae archaeon]
MVLISIKDNNELDNEDNQNNVKKNDIQILEIVQDFLDKNNINIKELFEWILKKNQKEFYTRLKSARVQFWSIVIIIAGIVSGLFSALFIGIILAETFL